MIRVLGIDPGGTTGLAVLEFEGPRCLRPNLVPFQEVGATSLAKIRRLVLNNGDFAVVAIERFVVSRRAGRSKTAGAGEQARNIIGAVAALCQEAGVPVVTRSASQVKGWATDKRLEAAGILAPTRGLPHARDAARHGLYAAVWDCGLPDPLSGKGT